MIEQSFEHGSVYLSQIRTSMLTSKALAVADIQFGPWRPINIHIEDGFILVRDLRSESYFVYENGIFQIETKAIMPKTDGFFYYYGLATVNNESGSFPYFLQNRPHVTLEEQISMDYFELPRTMQDLGYDQEFTYDIQLATLLKGVTATYCDRYKRPVQFISNKVFPVHIDNVKTTYEELEASNYPIVVDLTNTHFAMVDLEPGYSEEDLDHFNSLPGYYVEDTPRGGKHLLVNLNTDIFKYRYTEHLEIINNGMVTLYGINSVMLQPNPRAISVEQYTSTVKTQTVTVEHKPIHEDIKLVVKLLNERNLATMSQGKAYARDIINSDPDRSHGEYVALYSMYLNDIRPYERDLPQEQLPWILEAYSRDTIPYRDKHETERNGVPYLVYLSNEVIQYVQTKG